MPQYRRMPSAPLDAYRWDTPPQSQGQMVEVSYAEDHAHHYEAGHGAKFKRVTDHGDMSIEYFERQDTEE